MSTTSTSNRFNYNLLEAATQLQPSPKAEDWLQPIRAQGLAQLQQLAWPTRQTEAWKYTSLQPLVSEDFLQAVTSESASNEQINALKIPALDAYQLTFVNGEYKPQLSDTIPGILVERFSESKQPEVIKDKLDAAGKLQQTIFAELNNSLLCDGLYIKIPANKIVDKPIYLLQCSTQNPQINYSQQRLLIEIEANAQATFIDHRDSIGDSNTTANYLTEINVQANAHLTHVALQLETETQMAIAGTYVQQAKDSHYQHHLVATGSRLKRNDWQINLQQPGANATLDGVFLCKHQQHIDNQLCLNHMAPHCDSTENYRGLATDESQATFNGRIYIHRGAQKTNAHLNNKNLLLSKKATINTKPELEIYADDVKCAHGATIGQLNDDSLFYFQSRGIDKQSAAAMLSYGFINTMLEKLPADCIKEFVAKRLALFFNDVDNLQALDLDDLKGL